MADPISVVVAALVAGAASALGDTAKQAVKDAYSALKKLIKRKYAKVSVDLLEADPKSESRKAVVAEDLQRTAAHNDDELLQQATVTLKAVQEHDPEIAPAIGVDLTNAVIEGNAALEDIRSSGTGVQAKGAHVGGDFTAKGVRAGLGGGGSKKG